MKALKRWFSACLRWRSAEQFRRTLEKTRAKTVITDDGWIVGVYNQDNLNFNSDEMKELAATLRKLRSRNERLHQPK